LIPTYPRTAGFKPLPAGPRLLDATENATDGENQMTNTDAGILYGARAIATFLGVTENATYHLINKKRIPHFKIGKTVCATKDGLLTAFRRMELTQ
jgi:hypothetical protein